MLATCIEQKHRRNHEGEHARGTWGGNPHEMCARKSMVLDRTEHAGMKTGETTCTNAASTTAAPVHVPPTGNCAARQLMCHKHHKCDMRMHNSALGDDTARRRTSSAPHSARNTPSAASPTDVWARHPRTSRVPLLRFQSCGELRRPVTGHGRGWFLTSWTVTIVS